MNQSLLRVATATLVATAVFFALPLAARASGNKPGKSTSDTYIVIQVLTKTQSNDGKSDYKKEYKAITTKTLHDEVKKAKDDHDQAIKEWKDELKSDPKATRPPQWTPKKVSGTPIFETQKGAQDYIDKLKEEDEKKDDKSK